MFSLIQNCVIQFDFSTLFKRFLRFVLVIVATQKKTLLLLIFIMLGSIREPLRNIFGVA